MKLHILAITLILCLIPTSTARSQFSTRTFNPDDQPAPIATEPQNCREVLALEMQAQGQAFDPRTQDILDSAIAQVDLILDLDTGQYDPIWIFYQNILWDVERFEYRLDTMLSPVDPNQYTRAGLAEDAAIAIMAARHNPLCNQPVPR